MQFKLKAGFIFLFATMLLTNCVFAQKDTLVYYLNANGELAANQQNAYCRLVIFPVGSGSGPKFSAIKGYGMNRKLMFSGSSNTHSFPMHVVGPFTEYYPDGVKMSVKTYSNGFPVGDETDFYPNGNLKSRLQQNSDGDADRTEYFEDGTLQFEHHPTNNHLFKETYYYHGGKVARTVLEGGWGPDLTEYYINGKVKLVETQAEKGKKTITNAYFPNGNIYYKFERGVTKNPFRIQYLECRDSTGKPLTVNGNGYWVEYDENFALKSKTGKIVNGLADSIWTIQYLPGTGVRETYEKGKLVSSDWFQTKDTTLSAAAQQAPKFPGGPNGLKKFLANHVRYPAVARENNTQGRVIISFFVEKDGMLADFRIVSGIGDGCDDEVIRVMKTCPPWTPGTINGVPGRVKFAIPVLFSLSQNGTEGWITMENP